MQSIFHGVREYLTPVLTESAFEDKGILTPEEFVTAGDLLVYKCPTWRWESGDASLRRAYLPADKQFLVTRNVPCRRRVTSLELNYQSERAVEGEDEWVAAQSYGGQAKPQNGDLDDALGHISLDDKPAPSSSHSILDAIVDNYATVDGGGAAPDMSSFEEDNLVEDDAATLSANGYLVASEPGGLLGDDEGDDDNAILYTRTYDLSITYDKYYQTPRVWLFGYDEKSVPLSQDALFEDIMQDYANRTVTMEPHPHKQGLLHASIHPCQHAAVMKRILANLRGNDTRDDAETSQRQSSQHTIRSDQYLFLFLKFIQSVVPTIDYDHTIEVNAKK